MDRTNAERQRRYVQRLKDAAKGVTNGSGEVAASKQELAVLTALREKIAALEAENAALKKAAAVRPKHPPKLGGDDHRHAMDHPAERLRALWNSGRQKYQSFFAVLAEVQQNIGADALETWCIRELMIGPTALTKVAGVLLAADEAVVKRTFADAKQAEKDRRVAEKLAPLLERLFELGTFSQTEIAARFSPTELTTLAMRIEQVLVQHGLMPKSKRLEDPGAVSRSMIAKRKAASKKEMEEHSARHPAMLAARKTVQEKQKELNGKALREWLEQNADLVKLAQVRV